MLRCLIHLVGYHICNARARAKIRGSQVSCEAKLFTRHSLLFTRYSLLFTRYLLLFIRYSLLFTCYLSLITHCYLLFTRCYLLSTHYVLLVQCCIIFTMLILNYMSVPEKEYWSVDMVCYDVDLIVFGLDFQIMTNGLN